jgi:hypothetical protein
MSLITNIIVHVDSAHEETNVFLREIPIPTSRPYDQFLAKIDVDGAGGSLYLESEVYGAAVNYCNVPATVDQFVQLAAVLKNACVSIFHQDYAQTIEIRGGAAVVHEKWNTWSCDFVASSQPPLTSRFFTSKEM